MLMDIIGAYTIVLLIRVITVMDKIWKMSTLLKFISLGFWFVSWDIFMCEYYIF